MRGWLEARFIFLMMAPALVALSEVMNTTKIMMSEYLIVGLSILGSIVLPSEILVASRTLRANEFKCMILFNIHSDQRELKTRVCIAPRSSS